MPKTRKPNYCAALPARIALWVVENPYGTIDQCAKAMGCSINRVGVHCLNDNFVEAVEALQDLNAGRHLQMYFDAGIITDPDIDFDEE